ncbi:MAG: Ig-like domain-containing protein [Chloroflexi bacterium]|nr:Ig-like domain-containing protein [Chloroflexota bacterium]
MAALASCAPSLASPEPSSFGPAVPSATIEPPPPALRVAQTIPAEGDTLPLDGAIRVRFNQAIDRTSVEEALSRDESLPGRRAWPAPDTLEYSPAPEWPRDTTVRLRLSPTARAQSGARLAEEVRLAWLTTGYPRVGEVWPPSGSMQVRADSVITVTFDRPAVAQEGMAGAPSPLSLSPAVEGEGAWQNAGTYSFTPCVPLRGATAYEITVRADLEAPDGSLIAIGPQAASSSGVPLAAGAAGGFGRVPPPAILGIAPADGSDVVSLEQGIIIHFASPMKVTMRPIDTRQER